MSSYPPPPPPGVPPDPRMQPPPPQYAPAGVPYVVAPTDNRAIVSLVLGVASVVALCACQPAALVMGAVGFFLGLGSRRRIMASRGALAGDGMALAGIITSAVGGALGALVTLLLVAYLVLLLLGAATGFFGNSSG